MFVQKFSHFADGDLDNDGFFYAELNGKRGLIPSNYVITFNDKSTCTKYKNI
jgi:hypothetical protein